MKPFQVLRARWKLVSTVFLFAVGLILMVGALQPNQYSSQVRLFVQPDVYSFYILGGPDVDERDRKFASDLAAITSVKVLSNVIERLELNRIYGQRMGGSPLALPMVMKLLERSLTVAGDPSNQVIVITAVDSDRYLAAAVANEIASEFGEFRGEWRRRITQRGVARLRETLRGTEADVARAKARVEALSSSATVLVPVAPFE